MSASHLKIAIIDVSLSGERPNDIFKKKNQFPAGVLLNLEAGEEEVLYTLNDAHLLSLSNK